MATPVTIPSLGDSVSEAVIGKWLKQDGAQVTADDVIAELESDKANVELPAGQAGTLKQLKPEGATVAVGDVIAEISEGQPAAKTAAAPAAKTAAAATQAAAAPPPAAAGKPAAHDQPLAPSVRRLVTENDLAPEDIPATGREGRITKGDVLEHLEKKAAAAEAGPDATAAQAAQRARATTVDRQPEPARGTTTHWTPPQPPAKATPPAAAAPRSFAEAPETRVEMSKLRQTIARRLVEAQHTTASLTTFNEADMSAIMALRGRYKDPFEKSHGIGLGFMSFFAKALIHGIRAVPEVNAMIDGTSLVYRTAVHLGIAVSTERGLMVPVVRHADQMSMAEIELEIKRLAIKARDGKITVDDMAGGTITITNGGVFGSLLSTPILNPPQAAILGMHKIEKRPIVISEGGSDTIAIRPMMYLALTYDHRVIDGKQSVTFLVKVKEAIEDPTRILLEV